MTIMKTNNQIKHPCLSHHTVLDTICKPLEALGVNFFGYTALSQQGDAFCLGSKSDYAAAYLESNHVRSDVHYRPAFQFPTHMKPASNDKSFKVIENNPKIISLPQVAKQELRFKHAANYYLTAVERKCIAWLRQGKSADLIADILGVSRKTIERHIASIKRKYDSYTMYQLGEKIAVAGLADLL